MPNQLTTTDSDALPWYKQAWPWFIISIPATSIVLGINMFYLALNTNNSLVVDDYYKQGKAINQRIERDKAAASLGLSAMIKNSREGVLLQLDQSQNDPAVISFDPPDTLSIRWIHVTQAHKDGRASMQHLGGGRYLASGIQLPEESYWRMHVQPNEPVSEGLVDTQQNSEWRLVSSLQELSHNAEVHIVTTHTNQNY